MNFSMGQFQFGQTVEVLKSHLASTYEMDFGKIILWHEDTKMLDPMSISDYVSDPHDGIKVSIEGGGNTHWGSEGKGK